MKKHKSKLIAVSVLLIIAVVAFFYFFIPGAWIGGIDGISTESNVTITQWTRNQDRNSVEPNFIETVTEYDLNAEQIEMLKQFLRSSSFTRSLKGTLYHSITNIESYSTYDIIINDESYTAVHDTPRISISWGYFSGFKPAGNRWIKINNTNWEESILEILALSPESDLFDKQKAEKTICEFYDALKEGGFKKAVERLYFGDEFEFIRDEVREFPERIIDYIIEDTTKINDSLYEITILAEFDLIRPNMYGRGYNFVGRIDGNDYVILGYNFIPVELNENLNIDKYELFYTNMVPQSSSSTREINNKLIVQPGDPEYGMIIDKEDLLSSP